VSTALINKKVCRKLQGGAEQGNTCLQTPGTCESCPEWHAATRTRVLLHVTIPGHPVSWERVGWSQGKSFDPNRAAKTAFLWQLKAAVPNLRPDCQSRMSVRLEFWSAKTDAWNEDVDNFCKFYLDALNPEKPRKRRGQKAWEYDRLVAESMKTAFGPWGDDRQIDELYARVHRSSLNPRVEILVTEFSQTITETIYVK